jgi:uncharacterized protein (DUF2132 family)
MQQASKDPLHGKTLEMIVTELVTFLGWEALGQHIPINCFTINPSVRSSLTFLRKTPWARKKVEDLYVRMISYDALVTGTPSPVSAASSHRNDFTRQSLRSPETS